MLSTCSNSKRVFTFLRSPLSKSYSKRLSHRMCCLFFLRMAATLHLQSLRGYWLSPSSMAPSVNLARWGVFLTDSDRIQQRQRILVLQTLLQLVQ